MTNKQYFVLVDEMDRCIKSKGHHERDYGNYLMRWLFSNDIVDGMALEERRKNTLPMPYAKYMFG